MTKTADMIIENGRVLTMDPRRKRADAVAVAGGSILAVGERADIACLGGPATLVIDAAGGSVLPGFIESHIHLFVGGAELDSLSMAGLAGFDSIAKAIRRRAGAEAAAPILLVQQAAYSMFGEPITRELLDRILPDRPLALFASDHHTMWANTAALRAAGLLHGRTTPPGSEVVMGADGLAAGELREFESFAPVFALAPTGGREMLGLLGREPETPPAAAQRAVDRDMLRRGLGHAASLGITSIHNMDGNAYQLELLGEIDAAEGLPVRCRFPYRVLPGMELRRFAEAAELRERWNSDRLRVDFVKLFMDGVIESATAFMLADYSDRPGFRGSAFFETDEFDAVCIEAERLGFQLAVHAIGDAAVRRTLDGYQAARRRHGIGDTRHRIEHIEALDPADLPRFAELGVIASMQPTHAPGGAYPIEPIASMLGRRRLMTAYAWQTLRNAGARMAFSSDWPIAPLDPLTGIRTAMTRPPLFEGAPDERQSLADALAGFTADGAYAEFAEGRKGVLRPEALADIVVLSGDVEAAAPSEIDGLDVVATICGGRLIYRRDSVS
jgi:predicted amidohydrolase YtcJ